MLTAETLLFPPSNTIVPGSTLLKASPFPEIGRSAPDSSTREIFPQEIVSKWAQDFQNLLSKKDTTPISEIFVKEACWRDLLCTTWDFHTIQNHDKISEFIKTPSKNSGITAIRPDKSAPHRAPQFAKLGEMEVIQSFLNIETGSGRGQGLVRMVPDPNDGGKWKAFSLFTTLQEIKGHEERIRDRRPTGIDRDDVGGDENWKDRLRAQQNFEGGREPVVLIIGAGQGGLTVAARLKQLGLEALIIDQNPRIGDNWRNRYHQLVLHDSVWYDHMPYLSFPPNWPVFTPKDKLGDWFEYYAGILELNVWPSTTLASSEWNSDTHSWTVTLTRDQAGSKETRTLHPHHIVLATGHSGEPYLPPDIPGMSSFRGDRLIHSSQFTQPEKNANGKNAIVIGSCNSGHDIARDYYDHGYAVTMIQRSSTLVITSESLIDVSHNGLYEEDGPPTEDADLLVLSIPNPIAKTLETASTQKMLIRDSLLLDKLTAAGFTLDSGPDGSGLWMKYLSRGGGYYIDVGTSQLIADGKIAIKSGHGVKCINAHGLTLTDGTELEADEIVFATGYQNMKETARKIFGNEVEGCSEVWGFDQEGEVRGMWKGSGREGFWFMGGNLALCRFYSRLLALQILAVEGGLVGG